MEFRWNRWNIEHLAEHGVDPEAAEWVVENAAAPYPRRVGRDGTTFIIHARRLTEREKRRYRSRR